MLNFIRRNAEPLVQLVVAATMLVFSLSGPNHDKLWAGLLLVLTVSSFATLRDRHILQKHSEALGQIVKQLPGGPGLSAWDNSRFRTALAEARQVSVLAFSPVNFLRSCHSELADFLHRRGRLRLLVVDIDDHAAMSMARHRALERETVGDAVGQFWKLVEYLEESVDESSVTVRCMPYYPNYVMTLVQGKNRTVAFLTLNNFQGADALRASLEISSTREPEWIAYFAEDFERMWEWRHTKAWVGQTT